VLTVVVILGLSLRCYHYFRNPPVWHDEAAQVYNILHKDYTEILGPLYYSEACPPLFLAAEKIIVQLLGDGTLAMRLLPFLASCLAYVGMIWLVRPILPPIGLLWFALLLGCSDRLLWHACEAKPYALDVLVAVMVLAIGLIGKRSTSLHFALLWRLAVAAVLTPFLVFLSFPACFLLGGLALALLPDIWRARSWAAWALYISFVVILCGAFGALYVTAVNAQCNERIMSCWLDKFPPWDQPALVPVMALVRLSELFRYAAEPVGNVFVVFAALGAGWLWRRNQSIISALLLWPIALNGIAWLLSRYPLEASRVVAYASPLALLLIAAGLEPTWSWLKKRSNYAHVALVVLLLVPVGKTGWVLANPWKRTDSAAPAAFVLQRRLASEPVVGTLWEHAYYCRELGDYYRALVSQPTEPCFLPPAAALTNDGAAADKPVESLWLLTSPNPADQDADISLLHPTTRWHIAERHEFRDIVVLRLRR
jgi:hypothetical protein